MRYRSVFYALQVLEETEDAILAKEKHFVGQCREEKVREAMLSVRDELSPYCKVFSEMSSKVRQSGQFSEAEFTESEVEGVLGGVLRVWNLSVCPLNAML